MVEGTLGAAERIHFRECVCEAALTSAGFVNGSPRWAANELGAQGGIALPRSIPHDRPARSLSGAHWVLFRDIRCPG